MKFQTVLQWSVFGQQNVQAMQVCYGLCFKTDHKVVFLYSNNRFYEAQFLSLSFCCKMQCCRVSLPYSPQLKLLPSYQPTPPISYALLGPYVVSNDL